MPKNTNFDLTTDSLIAKYNLFQQSLKSVFLKLLPTLISNNNA